MRITALISLTIIFFNIPCSVFAQTPIAAESGNENSALEAYVDGIIDAEIHDGGVPGVTVSVVRDGRLLISKGYGFANIDGRAAADDSTLFRIGSVSKTFVWTAIMMLVERDHLDLDTDVNQYLKGIAIPDTFETPITLNDLMAHRAGFEDVFAVYVFGSSSGLSLQDALIKHMPNRVFPPGARTSYSNWGAALAAKIVEDITDIPFEEFLKHEMLVPLSMSKTTMRSPATMPDGLREDLAIAYEKIGDEFFDVDYMQIGPYGPAGSVASTADDMSRWMLVHLGRGELDGVRIMNQSTHDLMWSRAYTDRADAADLAHGFMHNVQNGFENFSHAGATTSFLTNMVLFPELNLGVFVSQNAAGSSSLIFDLPGLIAARVTGKQNERPSIDADSGENEIVDPDQFAGAYLTNRRSFSTFEKVLSTDSVIRITPGPDGTLTANLGGSLSQLRPLPNIADIFESDDGERFAFGRNKAGEVTHIVDSYGVESLEKVGFLEDPKLLGFALSAAVFFSITTWLGAWRRQGGQYVVTPTGRILSIADLIATAAVVGIIASIAVLAGLMESESVSILLNYPPAPIDALRLISLFLLAVVVVLVPALAPAWRSTAWSVWRKLHHTAFVASLAALTALLVHWNVIMSQTA